MPDTPNYDHVRKMAGTVCDRLEAYCIKYSPQNAVLTKTVHDAIQDEMALLQARIAERVAQWPANERVQVHDLLEDVTEASAKVLADMEDNEVTHTGCGPYMATVLDALRSIACAPDPIDPEECNPHGGHHIVYLCFILLGEVVEVPPGCPPIPSWVATPHKHLECFYAVADWLRRAETAEFQPPAKCDLIGATTRVKRKAD